MKILFDHLCFMERFGGVSKYFVEIIKRLPQDTYDISVMLYRSQALFESNLKERSLFIPHNYFKGQGRIMRTLNKSATIYKLKNCEFDIYHQTHYDSYAFNYLKKKQRAIVTIHDLNFITIPEYFESNTLIQKHQKTSAEYADAIIAVSNNTKKDLIERWNVPSEKIEVIHHGVNSVFLNNLEKDRVIKNPYILYVGSRQRFKNFERFIQSVAILMKKNSDLKLVCAGTSFSKEEKQYLQNEKVYDRTIQYAANETFLHRLYRDAEVFVYPSIYEGFGLPILEAMACGCPIALSNASCFPEIAGNAGVYFDPTNIDSMTSTMEELLTNQTLRQKQIELGFERIKLFSWEKSATKHYEFYKRVL